MNTAVKFDTITFEQLADVTGGFDWKTFGGAVGTGAVGGAVGGAAGGAATGAMAGGIGALPGAGIGALGGAVGGAITGGAYNAGQQFGWWK